MHDAGKGDIGAIWSSLELKIVDDAEIELAMSCITFWSPLEFTSMIGS